MGGFKKTAMIVGIVVVGVLGSVVLMVAVGAAVSPNGRLLPSETAVATAPVQAPVAAFARSEESVLFLSPRDLLDAYRGNEIRGDRQFKGKRVQVTGRVRSVERHLGDVMIGFGSGFDRVSAYLQKSEEDKASEVNSGNTNSVQCTVSGAGVMGGVMLRDCVIVGFVH